MIAIADQGGVKVLAKGSHADISKEIYRRRKKHQWEFPIKLVSDSAGFTTDAEYIRKIAGRPSELGENRQARMILGELQDGYTRLETIGKHLGLSVPLVQDLVHKYRLRTAVWTAMNAYTKFEASSSAELGKQIGMKPSTVRYTASRGSTKNGWKIIKAYSIADIVEEVRQ